MPAAVGRGPDEDVGDHRLHHRLAEGVAGLGVEGADLGEHLGEVLGVDPAELEQRRMVAFRHEVEIRDQRRHRRVVAVALAELDREALGEVAGADAGRLERLDQGQRGFGDRERRAEPRGDLADVGAEIAGLVDLADDRLADQTDRRVGGGDAELVGEMVGERLLAGDEGFEIVVVGADRRPRRRRRPGFGAAVDGAVSFGGPAVVVLVDIAEVGVELGLDRLAAFKARLQPFRCRRCRSRLARRRRLRLGSGASPGSSSPSERSRSGFRSSSAST